MKKHFLPTALVLFTAAAFAACTDNNEATDGTDKRQVNITATLTSSATADKLLRTENNAILPYAPANGTLTLFAGEVGSSIRSTFTYANDQWTTPKAIFWNELTANAGGIYPFFAAAPAVPAATPSVAPDQSIPTDYIQSDQLFAYTSVEKRLTDIPLNFHHVLSQLVIELKAGVSEDAPEYLNPEKATIQFYGAAANYTLNYGSATTDQPAIATSGDADAMTPLTPLKTGGRHYIILPPQALNAQTFTISITIDDDTYSWTNPDALTLTTGTSNKISLNIKKTAITLNDEGITVIPWGTPTSLGMNKISVDRLGDAATGNTYTAAVSDKLELIALQATAATPPANLSATYLYKEDTKEWTSALPLFWDDFNAAATTAFVFNALVTPKAEPVGANNGRDILYGTTTAKFGAPIQFTDDTSLKHAMSRLQITIKLSDDFGGSNTVATVTLKNLKTGTIANDGKGTVTLATDMANLIPENITPENIDQPNTYLYLATIAPQQAPTAADALLTFTVNGNPYTAKMPAEAAAKLTDGAFASGNLYTVTITVKKTAVSTAFAVAPWGTGNEIGEGDAGIDD